MSFRQDRTNPSTAVSNWRGRSETPKAWPSTRTSTWMNGGLFGGAGAGVSLEYISTFTVSSTDSIVLEITDIPQTYRDLVVYWHRARVAVHSIDGYWRPFTGCGAFISSRVNAGENTSNSLQGNYYTETSVGSKFTAQQDDNGLIGNDTNFMSMGEMCFMDYSNASTNTQAETMWNSSTSRASQSFAWSCCAFGQSGDGVGAMDTIRIQAGTGTGTASNYYFQAGSTIIELFGRGLAR